MKLKALLCVIFIGVGASAAESNTSRRLSYRKGIKKFAESREVSKDFVATLATIDIKHSLRQTPRLDIDNEVLCMVCDEVVNLVMEELQTGANPQDLVDVIIELCILLEVESQEVCAGTITISAPIATNPFVSKAIKISPKIDPHYLIGGKANCNEPLRFQSDKDLTENAADAAGYWGDYRDCDSPKLALDEAY
ncbi:hypothetical protein QE152_g6813 [Popillia japonica]|uniref:Saposin B-type domain-containing protein n=1 Tax=Popillia japonica TaxID=7064 RepID=A0AAW1MH79_POPJA